MSAQYIYDHAPLGAMIRFSDHSPQPPARFKRKLAAWKDRNACGQLICKSAPREIGLHHSEPAITLHMDDYGSGSVVVLVVNQTFGLQSNLDFTIESLPPPGSVRVLHDWAGQRELLHLAPDRIAADTRLTEHHYNDIILDPVGGGESLAPPIEGAAP